MPRKPAWISYATLSIIDQHRKALQRIERNIEDWLS